MNTGVQNNKSTTKPIGIHDMKIVGIIHMIVAIFIIYNGVKSYNSLFVNYNEKIYYLVCFDLLLVVINVLAGIGLLKSSAFGIWLSRIFLSYSMVLYLLRTGGSLICIIELVSVMGRISLDLFSNFFLFAGSMVLLWLMIWNPHCKEKVKMTVKNITISSVIGLGIICLHIIASNLFNS